jgi:DNA-binding NtrC family response regulator
VTAHLSAEQYRGLILGNSEQIRLIHHQIGEAARTNASVLITGETGTGKELAARAIVAGSDRHSGPFVTVDCTTLGRELIESELFGHERGAFTSAYQRKCGRVELAHRGTLFLDEIGELEWPLQAKLLRLLEQKEFLRIGGVMPIKVNVRIIAATNRNLAEEIRAGRFRADLFYRLHVVGIHLPPLRERGEDILLLAEHFLSHFARELRKPIRGFSEEVIEFLLRYQWPGNVRELENTIQRMVIFERGPSLSIDVLPREVRLISSGEGRPTGEVEIPEVSRGSGALSLDEATWLFRRQYVDQVLQAHAGEVNAAAQALNVNRTHLYKLIRLLKLTNRGARNKDE